MVEFDKTPGDSEGQESLVCCNSWVTKSQTYLVTKQKQQFFYVHKIKGFSMMVNEAVVVFL